MTTKSVSTKKREVLTSEHGQHLLREMIRIRTFEDKAAEMYQATKIRGFLHLYDGEEAIAVGVAQALQPQDAVVATYREHGQAIARGVPMGACMAELYGKQEGCARGRGGSMHFFDKDTNFFGGNAIVGGGLPLALGLGLAAKMKDEDRVVTCFFGDGAMAEGASHETMNLAALWQVPVFFVCENNQYAMGTALQYSHANIDLYQRAESYGIPAEQVDGMDMLAVEEASRRAVEHIRAGKGPYFIEFITFRFRPHSMFDAELYRDKEEVKEWMKRDPIVLFKEYLEKEDLINPEEFAAIEAQVKQEVDEAVTFAEEGTWEPLKDLERFVYSEGSL